MENECKMDEQDKRAKLESEMGRSKIDAEKEIKSLELQGRSAELNHRTIRIGLIIIAVFIVAVTYLGYAYILTEGEVWVSNFISENHDDLFLSFFNFTVGVNFVLQMTEIRGRLAIEQNHQNHLLEGGVEDFDDEDEVFIETVPEDVSDTKFKKEF